MFTTHKRPEVCGLGGIQQGLASLRADALLATRTALISAGSCSRNGGGSLGSRPTREARSPGLSEDSPNSCFAEDTDAFGVELGLDIRHRELEVTEG